MEDISADDDLLGDMLLDSLEFDPPISTHKMNYTYRSPRFDTSAVINLVRNRVVIEKDVGKALEELCEMPVIRKHLQKKTERQRQTFHTHARRYLEAYMPDAGFEFALTYRYQRSLTPVASSLPDGSSVAESSAAGAAHAQAAAAAASANAAPKTKPRRSGGNDASRGSAASNAKADICVIAVRNFKPGEYIMCKGGLTDLTKTEDEALRNEAAASRQATATQPYGGVLGQGRDFSIIKSSARNCSQLLLGPARFVNHDCDPSVEFSRNGHTMKFKVLRPIAINEEILVGYGEHYFGWQNGECLCATCESKGRGAFAREGIQTMQEKEEQSAAVKATMFEGEVNHDSAAGGGEASSSTPRRSLSQRIKTRRDSPPQANANGNGVATPSSTSASEEYANRASSRSSSRSILNSVVPSDRELVDPLEARGPKCQCLTCGAPFFAPETWWLPDECSRCERHYRIFKADWPGRTPTEGAFAAKSQQVAKQKAAVASVAEAAQKVKTNGHAAGGATGKGKSKDAHAGASAKAKGGRLSGGTSQQANASPAPVSSAASTTSLSSAAESSGSGTTPIRLSPLRTFEEKEDPTPTKSKARTSTISAAAAKPIARKPSKPVPPASDSGSSDLTDQSAPTRTSVNGESTDDSSGSSSDTPCGPKMLGKLAKTEALAHHWGVAEGEEGRRNRKPSVNGPVSLASKAALKAGSGQRRRSSGSAAGSGNGSGSGLHHSHGHRRTASRTSVFFPDSDDEDEEDESAVADVVGEDRKRKRPHAKTSEASSVSRRLSTGRSTGSADSGSTAQQQQLSRRKPAAVLSDDAKSPVPAKPAGKDLLGPSSAIKAATPPTSAAMPSASASPAPLAAPSAPSPSSASAPASAPHVLATHGPERTSIKNLAAHWSAGIDGGSRTRRQAQREPATVIASPAIQRSVSGGERRSNSPQPAGTGRRKRARGSEEGIAAERRGSAGGMVDENGSSVPPSPTGDAASRPSSAGPSGNEASTSIKRLKSVSRLSGGAGGSGSATATGSDDEGGRTRSPLVVEAALGGLPIRPLKTTSTNATASPSGASGVAPGSSSTLVDTNSPRWPGVLPSSSNGTGSSPVPSGGASPTGRVYQGIPGRKNLRIGRPGSVSRPIKPPTAPGTGSLAAGAGPSALSAPQGGDLNAPASGSVSASDAGARATPPTTTLPPDLAAAAGVSPKQACPIVPSSGTAVASSPSSQQVKAENNPSAQTVDQVMEQAGPPQQGVTATERVKKEES
ncbi:hypothetical protein BDZ90DRAFT_259882 [Jaminaea rosea]|uniref:SET domain-containing protein n=1 Tax=Jaminaea rosea TaxID=1569628 RepID=A0A316UY36_9BASI|nr:hypothetical protein BDZ90DRAFT_259882 [Jaminaea rosea]PWN28055.1 hypothetical protein BDZ90DRAFT_259882 [Jaminaea rosea]